MAEYSLIYDFGDEDSENFLFDQSLSVNDGIFLLNHVINKAVMGGNFGDHKFERDGVWELRVDYGPGYRVYYSIEDGEIILLLIGGNKKTQTADLDKAVSYLHDFKKRSI